MKPDKPFITAAVLLIAAACLIGLTWVGATQAIRQQRIDTTKRATAMLTSQALTFTEQINRQILAIDQTLRFLVADWEANPRGFELETARIRSVVLAGLSRDMVMTDETGIIRQSSVVEAINQSVAGLDYFRALAQSPEAPDGLYIGPAAIDGIMRQWHMNVARAMHYPDGSFAGVIDTDYRIAAITDVFGQADLGPNAFIALAGLEDGKLRGAVSASTVDPDAAIGDTPMLAAIQGSDSGVWTGPSPNDAVRRIHAFRRLPGRKLAVIVAMDEAQALQPAAEYRRQAWMVASGISTLLATLAMVLIQVTRMIRHRDTAAAESRANLAAANAQFAVASALAAAKTEQLDTTLSGMTDGVSIFDAHLCLVEWNARFPEIAGVPAEILRVGLPMEEVLRAQIRTGQFGVVRDPEAEVERRVARMRKARAGIVQRPHPDGRMLELRRTPLPEGGFVTIYTDVTERKRIDDALRRTQAALDLANRGKFRFAAILRHAIETRMKPLLDVIQGLNDGVDMPARQSMVATARQCGDALQDTLSDIDDWSLMEAGTLSIRPRPFELRALLEKCVELFETTAGVRPRLSVTDDTPSIVLADPDRLRRVVLLMLASAVKSGRTNAVWLTADTGHDAADGIRLAVRDDGPATAPETRAAAFLPLGHPERPEDADSATMDLAMCHGLVTLMGGRIGCDFRGHQDGPGENILWIALPQASLPVRTNVGAAADMWDIFPQREALPAGGMAATSGPPPRTPPRTRILLMEAEATDSSVSIDGLRRQGHHVDTASSTAALIQAMTTAPYDMVFIAASTTGSRGQEAAAGIRELSEPARSTPLIALLPDAAPDHEAALRTAGVDAVLSGRIFADAVADVLRRFVWAVSPEAPSGADVVANAPEQAFSAALSAERIGELRNNLPPATFANLIDECLVDMDHRLPALRRALTAGAPGAIAAHAHAMLGMAAGYGMVRLENRLRLVMNACREGDLATLVPTIVTDIESDFEEAAQGLRQILAHEPA